MRSLTNRSFASMMQLLALSIALLAIAAPTLAATMSIQFTGMDLTYDGSAIYDAGDNAGGVGDPADADPLTSVVFSVDGNTEGTLNNDISLDVFIPDVTGIPSSPGFHNLITSGANPGYFDLLIGTTPLAAQGLALDLSQVNITYLNSSTVKFVFGASVADILAQNLPFGLQIGDPVEVSFSAQVSSSTSAGGFVTGFNASGTGEITGTAIPEPSTGLLAALGLVVGLAFRGWNRNR